MNAAARARRTEEGFTLVELLAVIAILGVISFALTEALILGFKTTDGTIANVSRSAAIQVIEPYFAADAHSAQLVWTDPAPSCGTLDSPLVHLRWTELGATRSVAYALDPPTGGEQELVRLSCFGTGSADRRVLGHFTHDPAGPQPVTATCEPAPCPATAVAPATPIDSITLLIQTDPSAVPAPPINLTVRRRLT